MKDLIKLDYHALLDVLDQLYFKPQILHRPDVETMVEQAQFI